MGLFVKKKDEDEEEDLDEELPNWKKKRKKQLDLKDLDPDNSKKRKEPIKPWGKKERLIVLVTLMATIVISVIFSLKSNGFGFELPHFQFKFPQISIPFFREQTIIVKKQP